jgi:NTP pyrophosphatase (non-canonical NTP hydrolase)
MAIRSTIMNKILSNQKLLLRKIADNYGSHHNPSSSVDLSCGEVVEYIRNQQSYLNEEITEIILAISNDNRSILKPWSTKYTDLADKRYVSNCNIREEAIDMLCFCLNICLAAGITPDNIDSEYTIKFGKNISRQNNGY